MIAVVADVVGVTFVPGYPENLLRLAALEEWRVTSRSEEPITALLLRDAENEADPHAVAVHVPVIGHVGFVARGENVAVAALLDDGARVHAHLVSVRIHPDHPDRPGITVSAAITPKENA